MPRSLYITRDPYLAAYIFQSKRLRLGYALHGGEYVFLDPGHLGPDLEREYAQLDAEQRRQIVDRLRKTYKAPA